MSDHPTTSLTHKGELDEDQWQAVFRIVHDSIEPIVGDAPLTIELHGKHSPFGDEPGQVADRFEDVREELKAIRAELAPTGGAPHSELHDVVKEAQRVFTVHEGDLSVYLRDLRA